MSIENQKPLSIAARRQSLEADAALDQMYGHFTREEPVRPIVSDLDAQKAA